MKSMLTYFTKPIGVSGFISYADATWNCCPYEDDCASTGKKQHGLEA